MFNRSRSVYSSRRQAQKSALKPAHSRSGGSSRYGGGGQGRRGGRGENINTSRFINKTAVNCSVEQFVPAHKFADFQIDEILKKAIIAKGYVTPTPIQDVAIPHILKGEDLMGIANTGTGKTGAFLIPLINKVRLDRKQQVLIIAPTRELAIQIDSELKGFTAGMKIYSVCVVGGMSIGRQISELRYQYNFIIGTPGRLKDLINRKMIHLSEFNTVVLDEADRMLDMGFIDEMRFVMAGMPKERQTLFFSATLSPTIEKLIGEFLRVPIRVSVKKGDTAKNVDQDVVRIQKGENKFSVLYDLLTKKNFAKCLCLAAQKRSGEAVRNACGERHQGRVYPRQQKSCPAPASAGQVQRKSCSSFGGHRCGGARLGYRRHQPCHQLRHSANIR